MAHPIEPKAKALAMLMTGHSVKETAEACDVPKQTISRWKHKDLQALLREVMAVSPALRELSVWGRRLRQARLSYKTGLKKENGRRQYAIVAVAVQAGGFETIADHSQG